MQTLITKNQQDVRKYIQGLWGERDLFEVLLIGQLLAGDLSGLFTLYVDSKTTVVAVAAQVSLQERTIKKI